MASCRLPHPYGRDDYFGCFNCPRPTSGHMSQMRGIDFGLSMDDFDLDGAYAYPGLSWWPHVTPGSLGTNCDLGHAVADSVHNPVPNQEDTDELALLQKVYGVLKSDGKPFTKKVQKKNVPDVAAYVESRDSFFDSNYTNFKLEATAELDAERAKLRKVIEPGAKARKANNNWESAQNVFYAWVRKGYKNKLGENVDVAKLINAGMSESLQRALQKVRVDYGKHFAAGGFNPRPMKIKGMYRLGTISEHALGNAIDIDDSTNPHITAAEWALILKFTGKTLSTAERVHQWKHAPKDLYDNIKAINDEYVKRLNAAVANQEKKTAATQAKAGSALEPAIDGDETLKQMKSFVLKNRNGFLSMEWDLVKELAEEKFKWGATFPDPDIMHFEL